MVPVSYTHLDVYKRQEYIIERMLRKGLLLPIDTVFGKTPNYLHNESPYIREQLDKLSWSGPVSYTHLDVYKRQNVGFQLVDTFIN